MKGANVKKGTNVEIPLNFIHHHHTYWENPHSFCPERYYIISLGSRLSTFTHALYKRMWIVDYVLSVIHDLHTLIKYFHT